MFFRREDGDEFVAAQAAAGGVFSGGAPKDVCHVAKEFVSCHMAVEVVYFFETVQIHEEKGVGFFAVQFFCCVEDAAVVQEAGEGVMPCHAEGCFFSCASSAWDRIWKK